MLVERAVRTINLEDVLMANSNWTLTRRDLLQAGAGAAIAPLLATGATGPAMASAPLLGASQPTHYRFRLGNFEVTTIYDGAIRIGRVYPIFGNDQFEEDVQDQLKANFLPPDRMMIPFTPVIVNTGTQVVLFDTGNGAPRRASGAGRVAATLASAGFSPDQIDVVVLTHFHPDHIGGLMEGGKPLYANARYITGETEFNFWTPKALGDSGNASMAARSRLVQSNVVPLAEKMTFLKSEGEVVPGIRSIEAFGHTPGHMAFHIESGSNRLLLWGDVTNHYVVSLQQPDWHVSFDMDKEKAVVARKKVLDMVAAEKILATGYHMPFPAVGHVEKKGAGYRWVPVSYQLEL